MYAQMLCSLASGLQYAQPAAAASFSPLPIKSIYDDRADASRRISSGRSRISSGRSESSRNSSGSSALLGHVTEFQKPPASPGQNTFLHQLHSM